MWQSGYSDIFKQLQPLFKDAPNIYINNTAALTLTRFAFFTNYSPSKFQKNIQNGLVSADSELFNGFRFGDNYFFGETDADRLQQLLSPGDIFVAAQGKEIPGDWDWSKTPPQGFESLAVTYDTLGKPQFYLLTKIQSK